MTPNLFVVARKVCSPHRWFESKSKTQPLDFVEIWDSPIPGVYRHRPGFGWTLIATRESSEFYELEKPLKVVYAKCLHRYILEEDFLARRHNGLRKDQPKEAEPSTYFRMDDGITWIQCYDSEGEFIAGPYQRFVFDNQLDRFRPMLRRDNSDYLTVRNGSTSSSSAVSSLHTSTGRNSASASGRNSFDRQRGSVRCTPAGSVE